MAEGWTGCKEEEKSSGVMKQIRGSTAPGHDSERAKQTQFRHSTSTSGGKTSPSGTGNSASIRCPFKSRQWRTKGCLVKRRGKLFSLLRLGPRRAENIVRRFDADLSLPVVHAVASAICYRRLAERGNVNRRGVKNPIARPGFACAAAAKIRPNRRQPRRAAGNSGVTHWSSGIPLNAS